MYHIGVTDSQMEDMSPAGSGNGAIICHTSGIWNYSESSHLLKRLSLTKDLYMSTGMMDSRINPIPSLS